MNAASLPYIDPTALEADIAQFLPGIKWAVGLIPGAAGTAIMAVITALSSPTFLGPVVALINELSGATPPATTGNK
jgi:hypothetical protein